MEMAIGGFVVRVDLVDGVVIRNQKSFKAKLLFQDPVSRRSLPETFTPFQLL